MLIKSVRIQVLITKTRRSYTVTETTHSSSPTVSELT